MNFFIFSADPLYKFLHRLQQFRFQQLILFIPLITWLPLLILAFFSNNSFNLFVTDFDVHVRLLITLPLLLLAETIAERRFQVVAQMFIQSEIISEPNQKRYQSIIHSIIKLGNSPIVEVLIFLAVLIIGPFISHYVLPYDVADWEAIGINNSVTFTLPGYWYAYISLPIFQFVLLRWYYRIFIWYLFLWQVSRLPLQLNSLHPDRAGGIGFLVNGVFGLLPFLLAQSFLLSSVIFTAIININKTIWDFQYEIFSWLCILILIPLLPLTFFVLQLVRCKRSGTNAYSVTSIHYVNAFRKKWITLPSYNEKMLGSTDIQSLADLSNSFTVSAQMQILPIRMKTILALLIFVGLPFVPLLLTALPLDKLLMQLIKAVF